MSTHSFYKYSIKRDPAHSMIFLIPESDRWIIADKGKYLQDESTISSPVDIYKTRHKDTIEQEETKTCDNIKEWLKLNHIVYDKYNIDGSDDTTPENSIQRGDMIQLDWIEYRNDGSYLWDGENVIQLEYDIDDYGSVPNEFSFPEFSFTYFENRIVHNNLIQLSSELLEESKNNIQFDNLNNIFPNIEFYVNNLFCDRGVAYSTFIHNNIYFTIIGIPDSVLYNNIPGSNVNQEDDYKKVPVNVFKDRFIRFFNKGLKDKYILFEWEGWSSLFNSEDDRRVVFNIC